MKIPAGAKQRGKTQKGSELNIMGQFLCWGRGGIQVCLSRQQGAQDVKKQTVAVNQVTVNVRIDT